MPTVLKPKEGFVKTSQKHPANIPGIAEWTPKIKKILVKQIKNHSKMLQGFLFPRQEQIKVSGGERIWKSKPDWVV